MSTRKLKVAALLAAPIMALGVSGCNVSSSNAAGNGHHHKANDNGGGSTPTKTKSSKPKPHYTASQTQAIGEANDYLSTQAFSQKGLVSQLTSKYGSQFKLADAVFAVNHIKVSWNDEAVKAAREYLSTQHFSRAGLISQLTSSYGSKFTGPQATYAANKVGLR